MSNYTIRNQFLNTNDSASTENVLPYFFNSSLFDMPLTIAIATAAIIAAKNNNVVVIIIKIFKIVSNYDLFSRYKCIKLQNMFQIFLYKFSVKLNLYTINVNSVFFLKKYFAALKKSIKFAIT